MRKYDQESYLKRGKLCQYQQGWIWHIFIPLCPFLYLHPALTADHSHMQKKKIIIHGSVKQIDMSNHAQRPQAWILPQVDWHFSSHSCNFDCYNLQIKFTFSEKRRILHNIHSKRKYQASQKYVCYYKLNTRTSWRFWSGPFAGHSGTVTLFNSTIKFIK